MLSRYFLFALAAVAVFTAYMTLAALLRKDRMRERMQQVVPVELPGTGGLGQATQARPLFAIFCTNLLTAFGMDLPAVRRELYLPLWRAGFSSPDAAAYYLFFQRVVQPLFIAAACMVAWRFIHLLPAQPPISVKLFHGLSFLMLAVIGLFGTRLYVYNSRQKRQKIIQRAFPDMLDLLLICVESGLPLDAALARVCRELRTSNPEITAELDLTRVELNVRHDRAQALQGLADRVGTQSFRTFAASLIQSEQFGTSIADTLRSLADEARTTRMLEAENKAHRIPALITVPMIFFFIIPIFLIIMGPPIIRVQAQGGLFGPEKAGR